MARGESERIGDILSAIADIRSDTEGMDFQKFSGNPARDSVARHRQHARPADP